MTPLPDRFMSPSLMGRLLNCKFDSALRYLNPEIHPEARAIVERLAADYRNIGWVDGKPAEAIDAAFERLAELHPEFSKPEEGIATIGRGLAEREKDRVLSELGTAPSDLGALDERVEEALAQRRFANALALLGQDTPEATRRLTADLAERFGDGSGSRLLTDEEKAAREGRLLALAAFHPPLLDWIENRRLTRGPDELRAEREENEARIAALLAEGRLARHVRHPATPRRPARLVVEEARLARVTARPRHEDWSRFTPVLSGKEPIEAIYREGSIYLPGSALAFDPKDFVLDKAVFLEVLPD